MLRRKFLAFTLGLITLIGGAIGLAACGSDSHTHDFSGSWSANNTSHWKKCSGCDEVESSGAHTHAVSDKGVVKVEPTCTVAGTIEYTCTVCSAKYTQSIDPAHVMSDKYEHNASGHWTACKHCDYTTGVEAHDWDDGRVMNEADCETEGVKVYTCKICGEVRDEILPMGHKLTHTAAVEASCEASGTVEYWQCSKCYRFFSDAQGQNELALAELASPALGHAYDNVWTDDEFYHWHKCVHADCNIRQEISVVQHDWEIVQANGQTKLKCTVCGREADPTHFKSELHDGMSAPVVAGGNMQTELIIEPKVGGKNYRMSYEGTTAIRLVGQVYNITTQEFEDADFTLSPSMPTYVIGTHQIGIKLTVTSENSDAFIERIHMSYMLDDEEPEILLEGNNEITASTAGTLYTYTSESGGQYRFSFTSTDAVIYIDHDGISEKMTGTVELEMRANQIVAFYMGTEKDTDVETVKYNFNVHKHNATVKQDADGHHFECDCGYKSDVVNHEFNSTPDQYLAPTCTEDGYEKYVCTVCGKEITDVLTSVGHTWSPAFVTENGSATHWHDCMVCHNAKDGETAHVFEEVIVDGSVNNFKEAATTAHGVLYNPVCECGALDLEHEFEVGDPLPDDHVHDWSTDWVSDATHHWHICSDDNCKATQPGSEAEHTVVTDAGREATCTQDGITEGSHCSVCGKILVAQEVIAAPGHDMTKHAAKDATCTEDGNIEYYHCSGCNKNFADANGASEITGSTQIIASHSLELLDEKAANCTTAGRHKHWHCTVCGKNFADEHAANEYVGDPVIPADGHHIVKVDGTTPTCTEVGYSEYWQCDVCNNKFGNADGTQAFTGTAVTPALGHTYDNHMDADCNRCGTTRTIYHDLVWNYDRDQHWKYCSLGEGCTEGTAREDHVYDDDEDLLCNVCSYQRELEHVWEYESNDLYHWQYCSQHSEVQNIAHHNFVGGVCECGTHEMEIRYLKLNTASNISGSVGDVFYFRLDASTDYQISSIKLDFTGCDVVFRMAVADSTTMNDRGGYRFADVNITSGEGFLLSENRTDTRTREVFIVTLTSSAASITASQQTAAGSSQDNAQLITLGTRYCIPVNSFAVDESQRLAFFKLRVVTPGDFTFITERNGSRICYIKVYTSTHTLKCENLNAVYVSSNLPVGEYDITVSGNVDKMGILTVLKSEDFDLTGTAPDNFKAITVHDGTNNFNSVEYCDLTTMIKSNLYAYASFYTFSAPSTGTLIVSGGHVTQYKALTGPCNTNTINDSAQDTLTFNAGTTIYLAVFTDVQHCSFEINWEKSVSRTYNFRLVNQYGEGVVGKKLVLGSDEFTTGNGGVFYVERLAQPSDRFTAIAGQHFNLVDGAFFAPDGSNADGSTRDLLCLIEITVTFQVYLDAVPYSGNGQIKLARVGATQDTGALTIEGSSGFAAFTDGRLEHTFIPTSEQYNFMPAASGTDYRALVTTINNYYMGNDALAPQPGESIVMLPGEIGLYLLSGRSEIEQNSVIPFGTSVTVKTTSFRDPMETMSNGDPVAYPYVFKGTPGVTYQSTIFGDGYSLRKTGSIRAIDTTYANYRFTVGASGTAPLFFYSDWSGDHTTAVVITRVDGQTEPIELQPYMVSPIERQSYTGSALTPAVTIIHNGRTLTQGTDFIATYSNNVYEGVANVEIAGNGAFGGTPFTVHFDIFESEGGMEIIKPGTTTIYYNGTEKSYVFKGEANSIYAVSGYSAVYFGMKYEDGTPVGDKLRTGADGKVTITVYNKANSSDMSDDVTFTYTGTVYDLSELTITVGDVVFNGSAQTPTVSVTVGSKVFTKDVDFNLNYGNNVNAGTASVTVKGISEFCKGQTTVNFQIAKKSIEDGSSVVIRQIDAQPYTGSGIEPPINIVYNSMTLTADDFDVSYGNNVNVGVNTATATVTGKGNYSGTVVLYFSIDNLMAIDASMVSGVPTEVLYKGSAYTFDVTVNFNGTTLTKNVDYTVDYANNVNAGTAAKVIVYGTGDYAGTAEIPFTIVARTVDASMITPIKKKVYKGVAITPAIEITYESTRLSKDTDFTVEYTDNEAVGTAHALLTFIGNYKTADGNPIDFTYQLVDKINIAECEFTGLAAEYEYTGHYHSHYPNVSYDGVALTAYDYETSSSGDTMGVGTVRITITAADGSDYTGSKTVSYKIVPVTITDDAQHLEITGVVDKMYTGSGVTQENVTISVKFGTNRYFTTLGTSDYDLTYSNNVEQGTAVMTVTLKGLYAGTFTRTFQITAPVDIFSGNQLGTYNGSVNFGSTPIKVVITATGVSYKFDTYSTLDCNVVANSDGSYTISGKVICNAYFNYQMNAKLTFTADCTKITLVGKLSDSGGNNDTVDLKKEGASTPDPDPDPDPDPNENVIAIDTITNTDSYTEYTFIGTAGSSYRVDFYNDSDMIDNDGFSVLSASGSTFTDNTFTLDSTGKIKIKFSGYDSTFRVKITSVGGGQDPQPSNVIALDTLTTVNTGYGNNYVFNGTAGKRYKFEYSKNGSAVEAYAYAIDDNTVSENVFTLNSTGTINFWNYYFDSDNVDIKIVEYGGSTATINLGGNAGIDTTGTTEYSFTGILGEQYEVHCGLSALPSYYDSALVLYVDGVVSADRKFTLTSSDTVILKFQRSSGATAYVTIENLHTHTFNTGVWEKDANGHWHPATCEHTDVKGSAAPHSWGDWIIDVDATEDTEGSKHRACTVCGYVENATIPVTGSGNQGGGSGVDGLFTVAQQGTYTGTCQGASVTIVISADTIAITYNPLNNGQITDMSVVKTGDTFTYSYKIYWSQWEMLDPYTGNLTFIDNDTIEVCDDYFWGATYTLNRQS